MDASRSHNPPSSVRSMLRADTRATSRLHRRQLRHGLFPRLGAGFLRALHATYVDSPYGVALVTTTGPADGFLLGTADQAAHVRWVLRHRVLRLLLAAAPRVLVRPWLLRMFTPARVRRYARAASRAWARRRTRPDGAAPGPDPPSGKDDSQTGDRSVPPVAVLAHTAVSPALRGTGVGRTLVDAFVAAVGAAGTDDLRLVTDHDDGAGDFYEALGWRRGEVRLRDGRRLTEYRWEAR